MTQPSTATAERPVLFTVPINGVHHEIRSLPANLMIEVEEYTGLSLVELEGALQRPTIRLLKAMAWIVARQSGETTETLAAWDVDLLTLMPSAGGPAEPVKPGPAPVATPPSAAGGGVGNPPPAPAPPVGPAAATSVASPPSGL